MKCDNFDYPLYPKIQKEEKPLFLKRYSQKNPEKTLPYLASSMKNSQELKITYQKQFPSLTTRTSHFKPQNQEKSNKCISDLILNQPTQNKQMFFKSVTNFQNAKFNYKQQNLYKKETCFVTEVQQNLNIKQKKEKKHNIKQFQIKKIPDQNNHFLFKNDEEQKSFFNDQEIVQLQNNIKYEDEQNQSIEKSLNNSQQIDDDIQSKKNEEIQKESYADQIINLLNKKDIFEQQNLCYQKESKRKSKRNSYDSDSDEDIYEFDDNKAVLALDYLLQNTQNLIQGGNTIIKNFETKLIKEAENENSSLNSINSQII